MPSVPESVCCHEIGQIWQKIEEQTEVQMSCITEHPGFQSTCLDVWVHARNYILCLGETPAKLYTLFRTDYCEIKDPV